MATGSKTVSGLDVVRDAFRARSKRNHLGSLARDWGVSSGLLEQFLDGSDSVPLELIDKMVDYIFHGTATYHRPSGLLTSVKKSPPQSLGIRPEVAKSTYPPPWTPPADHRPMTVKGPSVDRPAAVEIAGYEKIRPGWLQE